MKKILLTCMILAGLAQVAWSQEAVISHEVLTFASETERELWNSGTTNPMALFQAVKPESSLSNQVWESLVLELDQKVSQKGAALAFLRILFQKSHQKLLKKYEQHSTFNSMLSEGKYDCVSGSAAIGLLLQRYGYSFEIVETDYHVFIVVNLDGKNIVLESTLPVGGMITTPSEVEKYLDSYKPTEFASLKSLNQGLAGPDIDYSDNSIFRKVNLRQLAGLQYYNDAIVHFNSQAFGQAVEQLSKAYLLYTSDRILGLRELSVDLAYQSFGYELKK
jgi:hypothetical protein